MSSPRKLEGHPWVIVYKIALYSQVSNQTNYLNLAVLNMNVHGTKKQRRKVTFQPNAYCPSKSKHGCA